MMLKAFFDDSGSDQQGPYYLLAGYASTLDRWDALTDLWDKKLLGPPRLEYFKMREANSLKDQFQGWAANERDRFVESLAEIIAGHVKIQVVGVVPQVLYDSVVKGNIPEVVDNPYFFCLGGVLGAVEHFEEKIGNQISKVDLVFDKQGKLSKIAVSLFQGLAASLAYGHLLGGIEYLDDKEVLPLQAADLAAWHIRRHNANPTEQRVVVDKIRSIPTKVVMATQRSLQVTVDGMRAARF